MVSLSFFMGTQFQFKSGFGLSIGLSSMFAVKGFMAQAFIAISKGLFGSSYKAPSCLITMMCFFHL